MAGSLVQVRPGVWKYREYGGKGPDGKERRLSRTFEASGVREAREVVKDIASEWKQARQRTADVRGTVTELVDAWYQFRVDQGDSPSTLYRTRSICDAIRKDLGPIRASELGVLDIDRWYGKLAKTGRGANTIHHYHRVLHAILRQARKWRKIAWNPAEDATPPRRDNVDIPTPTTADLVEILSTAGRSIRMAAYLAAATGARRGELVALNWSDLNGDQLTIGAALVKVPGGKVERKLPKSRKPRTITLDTGTLVALARHRQEAEERAQVAGVKLAADGPILAHKKDPTGRTPYPPDWLSQEWERLCQRATNAAIEAKKQNPDSPEPRSFNFRFHSLRHYHATQLIHAGVAIPTVSNRSGHAQISTTTDFYTKETREGDSAAAVALEQILKPLLSS